MKREILICLFVASAALLVAAACHRICPGFGVTFRPLLWPLAVLPFAVRLRLALVTAFAVPLVSCAVNGMPTLPVALSLSSAALAFAAAVGAIRCLVRRISARAG